MMRLSLTISSALAVSLAASAALAQVGPGGGSPAPGTGDSARISSGNRENNAEYNRLVGASDAKAQNANGDKAKAKIVAVPATMADIKAGAALRDVKGVPVGTIDSVTDQQVVVKTATTKIGVPLTAFGKDDKGLLLAITAQQFNDAVARAHAQAAPQAQQ